jgi:hypothetical protein
MDTKLNFAIINRVSVTTFKCHYAALAFRRSSPQVIVGQNKTSMNDRQSRTIDGMIASTKQHNNTTQGEERSNGGINAADTPIQYTLGQSDAKEAEK